MGWVGGAGDSVAGWLGFARQVLASCVVPCSIRWTGLHAAGIKQNSWDGFVA